MNIIIEGDDKKYYNKKPKGYSPCILGNSKHRSSELNVLVNCVGWAVGRFNQLGNYGSCKYLGNTNAENFTNYCKSQGLKLGQTPKVGACMVWEGKGSLAGHVCIVEKVISDKEVIISESGWNFTKEYYRTITRKKGSNNRWGMGSNYTFKGFIYNPVEIEPDKPDWTSGRYKLLYNKCIRKTPKIIPTNLVKAQNCTAVTKKNLVSPTGIARLKAGTTITCKTIYNENGRIWGSYGNCWVVICNQDETPQATKV